MEKAKIIAQGTSNELKKNYKSTQSLRIYSNNISEKIVLELRRSGMSVMHDKHGIEITASELDFYAIIDLIRSNNVAISGVQMNEPSLEDVFLQLTGKEMHK